jgi:uncharacterized membrane protein
MGKKFKLRPATVRKHSREKATVGVSSPFPRRKTLTSFDDKKRLQVEILRADLEAHRKIETWGCSLFLGALGLIAKQFVEWDLNLYESKRIPLTNAMAAFPVIVGVIAFVFLRIVNFRSHKTGQMLREVAGSCEKESWGTLGMMLSIVPLLFGWFVSWFLTVGHADRKTGLEWITITGGVVVLVATGIHIWVRRKTLTGRRASAR